MSKSYWMREQKGNFSNEKEDTFDESKRYVGIRLQQGVPLLDRDWNELEDIRRYEELMLRKWYIGNGTPDDGFKISEVGPPAKNDFKIKAGRCIVEGFEVVNDKEISYKGQKGVKLLRPGTKRVDTVYLDVWIEEVTHKEEPALENPQDVNVPTCVRHKLEWRVRVDEGRERHEKEDYHHYYDLAEIRWENKEIIEVKDLRTLKLTLTSVKNELEDVRKATANRWINGGEMKVSFTGGKYTFSISKMLCIIGGQEINFALTKRKTIIVKEGENCAVVVRATDETTEPEIEFIVTRRNLLEWLNSWTLDKWLPAEDTEPVLKSTFTLPLYFFEGPTEGKKFKITDLRHQGVLDMWLAELDGRLDSRERRMCRVPLLQQTILGWAVPVATVDVGMEPSGIAFDGAHIWVAHLDQKRVSKIDILKNREVATVDVGHATCGIAFDGTHIWVAHVDKSVSKIDILKDMKVAEVSVGQSPCGVAFDGTHIWVAHLKDKNVSKIDINTNKVVATVDVDQNTFLRPNFCGIAFDGTHIWVTNTSENNASKIDINTNKRVATVDVGDYPCGVAFDGAHIWVANLEDKKVSKIDIVKDMKVAEVSVGQSPCGVAFDGTHIWVAHLKDKNVGKIDINTNKVVATVDVGQSTCGVAFDGTHIWVANIGRKYVSKILRGDLK